MIHKELANISLAAICAGLMILLFGTATLGSWLGRRIRDRSEEDKDATTLATASMGLLALLIAFTYSIALARYDVRRQAVLGEANAIGSAANYALMLPPEQRNSTLDLLRRYTQVRVALGAPFNPDQFAKDIETTSGLQVKMWEKAVAASAAEPRSLPVSQFVSNLNEVNNAGERRLTALRNHTPTVVVAALVATAVLAVGFTAYASGLGGSRRWIGMLLLSILLSVLILLTIDLDRPDRGTIEVSTQSLRDALAGIPSAPPEAPQSP